MQRFHAQAGWFTRQRVFLIAIACLSAIVLLVPATSSAQIQNTKRQLCFYVEYSLFRSGHMFVQFLPIANEQRTRQDLVYGLYPRGRKILSTRGKFKPGESKRSWDWKICYEVTVAAYNAAAAKVRADLASPPDYRLLSDNCGDWVGGVAAAAGISLPTRTNNLGFTDPYAFGTSLSSIGDGGTYAGGVVRRNGPPPRAPDNSGDPPGVGDACSYFGLGDMALTSVEEVAAELGLVPHRSAQDPEEVGVGDPLSITLSNSTLPSAVVAYDWGDGSARVRHTASASHTYAATGAYVVRIVVLNSGAVNEFTLPVNVSSAGGPASSTISVPSPPPNLPEEPVIGSPPVVEDETAPGVPAMSIPGVLLLVGLLMGVGTGFAGRRRRGADVDRRRGGA